MAKIIAFLALALMGGVQLALEEIGERNPAAKNARPEQIVDTSFVRELDESGYIDALDR